MFCVKDRTQRSRSHAVTMGKRVVSIIMAVYKLTVTNLRDTYGARKFVILDKDT